jgi:hypothetical protein
MEDRKTKTREALDDLVQRLGREAGSDSEFIEDQDRQAIVIEASILLLSQFIAMSAIEKNETDFNFLLARYTKRVSSYADMYYKQFLLMKKETHDAKNPG